MSYFAKDESGYKERLRYLGDSWYIWESKGAFDKEYAGGYAGHESTFIPLITEQEKQWAGFKKI